MGSSQSVSSFKSPSGFRVLNVLKGSPAHEAGFEMFFDYIVEVNGYTFVTQNVINFADLMKQYENTVVKFVLFNARFRTFRDIWVSPRKWSDTQPGLLGASINFAPDVLQFPPSVRVLEVYPNSPASKAGLQPLKDYLLGTETYEFGSSNDVLAAIAAYERTKSDQGLPMFVYNSKTESCRVVTIHPSINWGGNGCLGCDIGEGIFHQIPPPTTNTQKNPYSRYIHHPVIEDKEGNTIHNLVQEVYIETQPVPQLPLSPPRSKLLPGSSNVISMSTIEQQSFQPKPVSLPLHEKLSNQQKSQTPPTNSSLNTVLIQGSDVSLEDGTDQKLEAQQI